MNAHKDNYLKKYYELHGLNVSNISSYNEDRRILETLKLVPSNWESVIDVGCGDGRVSQSLLVDGVEVIGIDWSESSLRNFRGKKIVADIKKHLPLLKRVDGAICAEVLEHLSITDARKVLANLRQNVEKGFVISVPAREQLSTHTVDCQNCGRSYHLWGHLQTFARFDDVDAMVEQESSQRVFVPYRGIHPSLTLDRYRRRLGYYPYSETATCPFCGMRLTEPQRASFIKLLLLWSLSQAERLTNGWRQETGWFICRYDI
jgi:SAM-dependent methyltransferase